MKRNKQLGLSQVPCISWSQVRAYLMERKEREWIQKIETAVKMIIEAVGEDANREGLQETPAREARMY